MYIFGKLEKKEKIRKRENEIKNFFFHICFSNNQSIIHENNTFFCPTTAPHPHCNLTFKMEWLWFFYEYFIYHHRDYYYYQVIKMDTHVIFVCVCV